VILLDTDTCVELLHGTPHVVRAQEECGDVVAASAVTAAELYFGAAHSSRPEENRRLVDVFFESVPLCALDGEAARWFGEIKAGLRRAGQGLPDADLLIAATALSLGAVLVTGNRGHYERVPGLRTEDWIR